MPGPIGPRRGWCLLGVCDGESSQAAAKTSAKIVFILTLQR
jgi:hypothetical protein